MMEIDETLDLRFQEAVRLTDEGRHREALAKFELLIALPGVPRSLLAATHGKIGYIHQFALGDPAAAEGWFRKSAELAPSSELASLGLFHALVRQRKVDEAFDEMRRYLARKPSAEYTRILAEINDGNGSEGDEG
jgi:predicted Zn-dependent protease